MMGMVDNVFDTAPIEDMPAGYPEIRNHIKLIGMSIKDNKEIVKQRAQVYAGVQNISVDNINKNNNIRFDIYKEFIRLGFPYISQEDTKEESKGQGTIEDLIAEYKRLFPQEDKNESDKK